jgi:O-acetyl-ADP-ribose deacetylase (regulator of RNase III)
MDGAAARRVEVVRGDITQLDVQAVVNAANEQLAPGGGVCGAIHRAAGPGLADFCRNLGSCPTGEARLTPGFGLRAAHVIHAVGPVWRGGSAGEEALLRSCYRSALALARAARVGSVAFPCIGTGIFGYPPAAAARVAVAEVLSFLAGNEWPRRVLLCAFSQADERILADTLARATRGG